MMRRVLRQMGEKSINTDLLAQDLDIGRGTLDAILETAIREGYVEKMSVNSDCGNCLLSSRCKTEPSECDRAEMYILTLKGRKYIKL